VFIVSMFYCPPAKKEKCEDEERNNEMEAMQDVKLAFCPSLVVLFCALKILQKNNYAEIIR
jgi:hypothetical protein